MVERLDFHSELFKAAFPQQRADQELREMDYFSQGHLDPCFLLLECFKTTWLHLKPFMVSYVSHACHEAINEAHGGFSKIQSSMKQIMQAKPPISVPTFPESSTKDKPSNCAADSLVMFLPWS